MDVRRVAGECLEEVFASFIDQVRQYPLTRRTRILKCKTLCYRVLNQKRSRTLYATSGFVSLMCIEMYGIRSQWLPSFGMEVT